MLEKFKKFLEDNNAWDLFCTNALASDMSLTQETLLVDLEEDLNQDLAVLSAYFQWDAVPENRMFWVDLDEKWEAALS